MWSGVYEIRVFEVAVGINYFVISIVIFGNFLQGPMGSAAIDTPENILKETGSSVITICEITVFVIAIFL